MLGRPSSHCPHPRLPRRWARGPVLGPAHLCAQEDSLPHPKPLPWVFGGDEDGKARVSLEQGWVKAEGTGDLTPFLHVGGPKAAVASPQSSQMPGGALPLPTPPHAFLAAVLSASPRPRPLVRGGAALGAGTGRVGSWDAPERACCE